jgi:hypothetical protein
MAVGDPGTIVPLAQAKLDEIPGAGFANPSRVDAGCRVILP